MNSTFKPGKLYTIKEVAMNANPGDNVRTQGLAIKFEDQILTLQGLDNISTIEIETDLIGLPMKVQSFYTVIGEIQLDHKNFSRKVIRATVCRELTFRKYNVDFYEKEMMRCLD